MALDRCGRDAAAGPDAASRGVPARCVRDRTVDAPVDLDGNGISDLVWWDFGSGAVAMWMLGPSGVIASNAFAVDTSYRFVGAGDVDRDGDDDLVWQRQINVADNVVVVWEMDGPQVRSTSAWWPPSAEWVAQAVADVDGDGAADVVLTAPDETRATTRSPSGSSTACARPTPCGPSTQARTSVAAPSRALGPQQ